MKKLILILAFTTASISIYAQTQVLASNASCVKGRVVLKWITQDAAYVEIHESNDGFTWQLTTVSTGNTFTDNTPSYFYRVVAIGEEIDYGELLKGGCKPIPSGINLYY